MTYTHLRNAPKPKSRLVRRPDGTGWMPVPIEPLEKTLPPEYIAFAKVDHDKESRWIEKIEGEWKSDKKRRKNAFKDAKKKAKLRSKQNRDNAQMAAENAQIARRNLNMTKTDIITIAKSIVAKGPGAQPGFDSKDFYCALKIGAAEFRKAQPTLSEAQAFAKYLESDNGKLLFRAMKAAPQVPCEDTPDDDDPDEEIDPDDEGFAELSRLARETAKANPTLSYAKSFALVASQRSDLVAASKAATRRRVLKAWEPADGDPVEPSPGQGQRGDAAGVDAYERLCQIAAKQRRSNETLAQAFARVYASPEYAHLIKMQKAQHLAGQS